MSLCARCEADTPRFPVPARLRSRVSGSGGPGDFGGAGALRVAAVDAWGARLVLAAAVRQRDFQAAGGDAHACRDAR